MGLATRMKEATQVFFKGARKFAESYIVTDQGADELHWQFTRLTGPGGLARIRSLTPLQQSDMLELAHAMYKGNPIANRGIDITAEYVIGDGIQFTALSDGVQQILNEHWDDPTNDWSINQIQRTIELGLAGEECIPVTINPDNGHVTLGYIDPTVIDQVVMDTKNSMKTHAVILKDLPNQSKPRRAYRIINVADVSKDSPVSGKLVGLAPDAETRDKWDVEFAIGDTSILSFPNLDSAREVPVEWVGSCFFFKVNSPLGATRGWSDLTAGLDWLDQHDQFLFSMTEKAVNAGKYVVDVLLKGMTEDQQAAWLAKRRQSFNAGEWVTRNEDVEYNFPAPDLKLEDSAQLAGLLKNHVVAALGHPPIWYAESASSRASAPEMTEPSFKHLRTRQRLVAYMISQIFRFAIDQASIAGTVVSDGRMTPGGDADLTSKGFYLRMPDISAKDQRMMSIAVSNIARALKEAIEFGFEQEEAVRVFERYLELLGLDAWRQEVASTSIMPDPDLSVTNVFKASVKEGINPREFVYQGSKFYIYASHSERQGIREAVMKENDHSGNGVSSSKKIPV